MAQELGCASGNINQTGHSPFTGSELFSQELDPLLMESKDKHKLLPTIWKAPRASHSTAR